jgi:hypothetical protein
MANVISNVAAIGAPGRASERAMPVAAAAAIPWYVWCLAAAATSGMIGGYWDISWHMSIGRDTFWTAPHMAIYLAGVLAGVASGYAILSSTFASSPEARAASVRIWGFYGPLGCFIAAWGGIAMLTSAPFDNWWHNAYGLDVKILSLPHSVLAAGSAMITWGALLLICAEENRSSGERRARLDRLLLFVGGVELTKAALFVLERTWVTEMHSSAFYFAAAADFPLLLVAISAISRSRWPATTMASIYTVLWLAALWLFPLFPAEPKLGPVYQRVTHFVPLGFPLLLIVPAVALDLLRLGLGERWGSWKSAALAGCAFLAALIVVQWPFGDFLMAPIARNWIFGRIYFAYSDPANLLYNPYRFYSQDKTNAAFAMGMTTALIGAIVVSSLGMALGNWMRRVKR